VRSVKDDLKAPTAINAWWRLLHHTLGEAALNEGLGVRDKILREIDVFSIRAAIKYAVAREVGHE